MLMYEGNKLGHQRWVKPIQQIEKIALSYPECLPSLVAPVLAGNELIPEKLSITAEESEKCCLPPHMTSTFTRQSPPP